MVKRIDFISQEEFERLYKFEKDKIMKFAMLLMFGSGLRISEVVGLEQDYLVEGKTKRQKGIWKINPLTADKIDIEKHQVRIDEAKGGKWRVSVLSPAVKPEMLKLLPIKMNRRTFQRRLATLSQEVLGKTISPHTLRHGFGNYCANVLKLPLPMVQSFMGHSKLETTGIYTKVNPEHAVAEYWKGLGVGK